MIDAAPNDMSRITPPKEVRKWRDGGRTPMGDYKADDASVTEILQSGSWRFTQITGDVSGEQVQPQSAEFTAAWYAERDPLDAASEDRIRLLAKKFESGVNREELARLEILSARLSRLAPQVTAQDVQMLEEMAEKIEGLEREISGFVALGLGR